MLCDDCGPVTVEEYEVMYKALSVKLNKRDVDRELLKACDEGLKCFTFDVENYYNGGSEFRLMESKFQERKVRFERGILEHRMRLVNFETLKIDEVPALRLVLTTEPTFSDDNFPRFRLFVIKQLGFGDTRPERVNVEIPYDINLRCSFVNLIESLTDEQIAVLRFDYIMKEIAILSHGLEDAKFVLRLLDGVRVKAAVCRKSPVARKNMILSFFNEARSHNVKSSFELLPG